MSKRDELYYRQDPYITRWTSFKPPALSDIPMTIASSKPVRKAPDPKYLEYCKRIQTHGTNLLDEKKTADSKTEMDSQIKEKIEELLNESNSSPTFELFHFSDCMFCIVECHSGIVKRPFIIHAFITVSFDGNRFSASIDDNAITSELLSSGRLDEFMQRAIQIVENSFKR